MLSNFFSRKNEPEVEILPAKPDDPRTTGDAVAYGERMATALQRTVTQDAIAPYAMDSVDPDEYSIKGNYGDAAYMPIDQIIWYSSHSFIGYQACILIAQHWLVDKICTMPARDAVRVGWELKGEGLTSDIQKEIRKQDKRFKIRKNLIEFERLNRIFGQRIMMFVIDSNDEQYYEKPFNPDGITPGSFKGIVQIDPTWCVPLVENTFDPTQPDFYEPKFYRIGNKLIHKSHLVINKTCEVPDVMKPTYRYGGIPLPQKIMERIYGAERTANEAPMLAMTKRLDILKLDLLDAMGKKGQFKKLMDFFTKTRDNYGVKVIGENESMERLDTSLADLDAVIMTQYQLCAACGEIPATKVIETTPKGFNSTGEFEEASYHERLESVQEHNLSPVLDRYYTVIMRSEIEPKFPGSSVIEVEAVWNPLDSPTELEWSDINLKKAQTGQILQSVGAIDGADERQRLKDDPDSGYMNIEIDDDADPLGGTGENIFEGLLNTPTTLDNALFERATGRFDGAILITNQEFLNDEIVARKIQRQDFNVQVSPVFEYEGKKYRTIIDGHHSLAGAVKAGQTPNFIESDYRGSDYKNAVTKGRAFDGVAFNG